MKVYFYIYFYMYILRYPYIYITSNSHRLQHDLHKGDWEEVGERERKDLAHESLDGPRCRGVREGVHCNCALYGLLLHPRDGDLRS